MAEVLTGRRSILGPQRDPERHRTYKVKHLVKITPGSEGGIEILNAPDLPQPGDELNYDGFNDPFAFCQPDATVEPLDYKEGELPEFYVVEQTFSTRPTDRCRQDERNDPLMEPQKVRGSFKASKEEGLFDRFGRFITTSSWELIRGQENQWDYYKATVEVEQNVADLELDLCTFMMNRVNMEAQWGLPARCIKLSEFSWDQQYHGRCLTYYTRKFGFDIDFRTHDRDLVDEATKALRGKWVRAATNNQLAEYQLLGTPNRFNPNDFIRFQDPNGNPGKVILNGYGLPSGCCVTNIPGAEDTALRYYVAYANQFLLSGVLVNQGKPLTDKRYWVEATNGIVPTAFNGAVIYVPGDLVTYQGRVYLCLSTNYLDDPATSLNWAYLSSGVTNLGVYSTSETYQNGSIVREQSACSVDTGTSTGSRITQTGYVHVEKYLEANLLLLGVPAVL